MINTASLSWLENPVAAIDENSRQAAVDRQAQLTKPPGSLGRLETVVEELAGWQGTSQPVVDNCLVRVFAADHGIVEEGVSAFPQSVTVEMVRNFARGGAAISVLSQHHQADFAVVNLGTVHPLSDEDINNPLVHQYQLAKGTGNICREAAMSEDLLAAAINAGASEISGSASASTSNSTSDSTSQSTSQSIKADLFIGGEMGIGNTATTAALTSVLLGLAVDSTVGIGTGVDDAGFKRKQQAVERAVALHQPDCSTPLETLRRLGGLEIAALVGAYISAAQKGVASLVDGYICTVAALIACRINVDVRQWLMFSHRSVEPGHSHLLEALQAQPLLELEMRLGEGSGAAVALSLLKSACQLHNNMATFAEASVSNSH